jgi:peptidoglycan/LPS O-acetylase OafA/YrhL
MKYIKELDTIRALAITSVVVNHWFPEGSRANYISTVVEAPNIFFTISAFLVTTILLNDRQKAEKQTISKKVLYRNFFLKRALRIFPAYYLTILGTYIIQRDTLSPSGYLSFSLYLSNIYIYLTREWGYLAHLWSIAVEQQFYTLWPLLILFVKRNYLPYALAACIVAGVVSQHLESGNGFEGILTNTVLDTLGIGALLAWFVKTYPHLLQKANRILWPVALGCVFLIIGQAVWGHFFFLHNRTLMAIVTVTLIIFFIVKSDSSRYTFSFLFRNSLLIFIGKISYGIYLYHLTVFFHGYRILKFVNNKAGLAFRDTKNLYMLECMIILIVLSWISWKYIELPISNLKKYITVKTPALAPEPVSRVV